ncbi:MAG: sensor histidine kinase, partial [Marinicella sp.]
LHATELKALKAQLNPHFIFNCLNNMRAMAIDDGEKTREMITNLSEILKYSFQFGDQTQVTVEREIQHVQNYLALEEIQFEQRLSYDFDIDPATTQQLIPTLSIQLLVENAIKHGITNLPSGGHIKIQVSKSENQLRIIVTNTGYLEPNKTNKSTGVGLSNLEKRLQLAHSDRASLHLYSPNAQQVTAEISLPFGGKINE